MNIHKSKAGITCTSLLFKALENVKEREVKKQKITLSGIQNTNLNEKEDFIPIDFVMIEPSFMHSLSKRSRDIVCKIINDLKIGNVFWYFDQTKNTRDSTAIKELRDKKIIYPTEITTIHFINPFYIRRGRIQEVLMNTMKLLSQSSCVSIELIKNLKTGRNVDLDVTQLLSSPTLPT